MLELTWNSCQRLRVPFFGRGGVGNDVYGSSLWENGSKESDRGSVHQTMFVGGSVPNHCLNIKPQKHQIEAATHETTGTGNQVLWGILLGCSDFNFLPTHGFFRIKLLKVLKVFNFEQGSRGNNHETKRRSTSFFIQKNGNATHKKRAPKNKYVKTNLNK